MQVLLQISFIEIPVKMWILSLLGSLNWRAKRI